MSQYSPNSTGSLSGEVENGGGGGGGNSTDSVQPKTKIFVPIPVHVSRIISKNQQDQYGKFQRSKFSGTTIPTNFKLL